MLLKNAFEFCWVHHQSSNLRWREPMLFTSFFSPAGFYDVPRVLISPPSWTDGHTWYQSQGCIDQMPD